MPWFWFWMPQFQFPAIHFPFSGAVAQRIVTAGGALTRLSDLQPSLEEVYTHYFQEQRHAA